MIDPTLYSDYRAAKKAAAVLANACGATLLQTEAGKPRVILGKTVKTFPTWLASWSWLHQIRQDQISKATAASQPAAVQPSAPSIRRSATILPPMAILLD